MLRGSKNLLKYNNFLVFGAARSGLAAARLLRKKGKNVTILDEASPEKTAAARRQAEEIGAQFVSSVSGLSFHEIVILSPGIPPSHPVIQKLSQSGSLIRSEIELGYEICDAPLVGITGTNGKTTVTHLTTHLFRESGRAAVMAGNVGRALCDAVLEPELHDAGAAVICEISSFQLETIERFHPRVACILNVTPDHLERYGTVEKYAEAKFPVTANQDVDDDLVINAECAYCRDFAARSHARIWKFSSKKRVERGAYLADGKLVLSLDPNCDPIEVMPRADVPLPGMHNIENVLAALSIGAAMGLPARDMANGVRTFRAVPHRIEPVGEVDGVRYYNDSKATNLDSLEKALLSFNEPIILIAGGRDKGAPWTVLNELVAARVKGLVLVGEAAAIGRAAWASLVGKAVDAGSMAEAVSLAHSMASPGDVVLLSPACASYDMYRNFEERGDDFRNIVAGMKAS